MRRLGPGIGMISLSDMLAAASGGQDEVDDELCEADLTENDACPLKGEDYIQALRSSANKIAARTQKEDWKTGDILRYFDGVYPLTKTGWPKKGPPIVFIRWLTDEEIKNHYERIEPQSPGVPYHLGAGDFLGGYLGKNTAFIASVYCSELMEKVDA